VEHGYSIADAILDSIGGYDCDLVIMGTHGRRPLSQLLMGSVARRVVRLSPVPVITTHAGVEDHFPPRKILVAYDSSEASLEAVRCAQVWASAFGARVVLFHAVEPVVYPTFYTVVAVQDDYVKSLETGCKSALEKAAVEHLTGIESECVVIHDSAARGITTYAREHDCDLVVLATRGLSGVAHVLLGSVAERVVRSADVPVLTVRA
jgi:nucleotide-binding universal stress UspA family protein